MPSNVIERNAVPLHLRNCEGVMDAAERMINELDEPLPIAEVVLPETARRLPPKGSIWLGTNEYVFDIDHPATMIRAAELIDGAYANCQTVVGADSPEDEMVRIKRGAITFPAEIQILTGLVGG